MENLQDNRDYSKGSWDLRKGDRRKRQLPISFPDRRQGPRRSGFIEMKLTNGAHTRSGGFEAIPTL
jgi:hypothetical protein